jgi:aminopeptidase-like protein
VATFIARYLCNADLRYSYRFLFVPGTIGSIAWLSQNEQNAVCIRHGLVMACLGDSGKLTYKKSRRSNAEVDRAVQHLLEHSGDPYEVREFSPYGYDERQYCSPGFDLPVGSLTRTPNNCYPEYHTSADGPSLVRPESLLDSLVKYLQVFDLLETNAVYVNVNPKCEPQLGKRGLYRAEGGKVDQSRELATLWVLNQSDGQHSLLDIADRSGIDFWSIRDAAAPLVKHNLLKVFAADRDQMSFERKSSRGTQNFSDAPFNGAP